MVEAEQNKNAKQNEPNYQYNKAQYHPVEEYLVTSTEKLTSDTPSFVLEVTWPRVALFYHPASPLCIQLRDRYVAVAREIRRRSIRAPVEFWAISCEVHRDACEDLGVSAVPRILAFPGGRIDGVLVPRTSDNDIEVEKIIDILNVHLKDADEEEINKKNELDEDNAKLREIEERAKAANDPYQLHVGETDHMREILHPHSALSDVYADAMASLLHSIDGATKKDNTGFVEAWSWDQYHAFREWLDLMHWALPTRDMAMVHNIINDMRNNIQSIENRPDEVTRILASHDYYKKEPKWSSSCEAANKLDKGYACGFWKLLHVVSIGVVEQHHSVMGDLQRVVVPHITTTIRDYVQFYDFAKSRDGTELLLEAFEDCFGDDECQSRMGIRKKGLFARFRRRNIPGKKDKSWKELSIFLWKIHQEYRHRRLSKTGSGYDSLLKKEDLQWPPSDLCPTCISTQGMPVMVDGKFQGVSENLVPDALNQIVWKKDKVFEHLKHEYWPRSLQTPRVVVLDRWDSHEVQDALHHGGWGIGGVFLLVGTLLFCGFALWTGVKGKLRPRSTPRRTRARMFTRGAGERQEFSDNDSINHRAPFQPRRRTNGRVQGFKSGSSPFLDD